VLSANDVTGNDFDGIVHGASPTQDRLGNQAGAYAFNRVNNYIELPSNAMSSWNELILSVWINAPEYNGNGWLAFFGSYVGSGGYL